MIRRRDFGRLLAAFLMGFPLILTSGCAGEEASESRSSDDLPSDIRKMMAGAYGDYRSLEEEDRKLFLETYKGGQALQPLKVRTQVVAGLNYRFLCQQADDRNRLVEVTIYQPLPGRGAPEVTRVEEVRP